MAELPDSTPGFVHKPSRRLLWASKASLAELLLNRADRLILANASRDADAFRKLVIDVAFDVVPKIGHDRHSPSFLSGA